jgi:hypothetical protein
LKHPYSDPIDSKAKVGLLFLQPSFSLEIEVYPKFHQSSLTSSSVVQFVGMTGLAASSVESQVDLLIQNRASVYSASKNCLTQGLG